MSTPGMNGREIDFIPDRLIDEPVVFRGMTDTEVVAIIFLAIAFWIPVCVLLLLPFGWGLIGVGVGFGAAILTLLLTGEYLQRLKRKMPDGLHVVHLKKLAQRHISFIDFGYIETSQRWDIRRQVPVKKIKIQSED